MLALQTPGSAEAFYRGASEPADRSGGILPLALGVPLSLGVLAVAVRLARRRERRSESS